MQHHKYRRRDSEIWQLAEENDDDDDYMTYRIVPKITKTLVYGMLNEKHRKRAEKKRSYVIPYTAVGENVRVNYIIDYYRHRVIEVNPLDWETVVTGRATLFTYGIVSPRFARETFTAFYRCAFWTMCTTVDIH